MWVLRNSSVAFGEVAGGDDRIEREVAIPAPIGPVWSALTRSPELSAWFGADVEIDLRPGGRVSVRARDGWERPGVVEEIEPYRRLSVRWLPFERWAGGAWRPAPAGRVEFLLDEENGGTRVRVVEWLRQPSWAGDAADHAVPRVATP